MHAWIGNVCNAHQFHDVELKQRLMKVWHGLGQSVTDAMHEWHKHLWACIHAKGGHFEHLIRLESTRMLMFRSKSVIVLNISRVLLFLSFVFHKVV